MWEPHFGCRGCCVWHACVEHVFGLGFGVVGGASPLCVGAPVCGCQWCVCGVDLSSPYCGALPSTSRVVGSVSLTPSLLHRVSLCLSHTPQPIPCHPMPSPWLCGACSGTSPALHKCRPPQSTHTHPLLPQGCHAPDVLCVSLLVCVHNGTVFCFLAAVFPPWFAALTTVSHPFVLGSTPQLCGAVLCAVPCV
jgi:hypothetical protein